MSAEPTSTPVIAPAAVPAQTALVLTDPWAALRAFTPARIALGRTGASQPTSALLAFSLAHAQARDAVHEAFNAASMSIDLQEAGFQTLSVHSRATDRPMYLRRPDFGRRLDAASSERLREAANGATAPPDLVLVVADGLSALAVARHAQSMLKAIRARLPGWTIGPVVLAEQARVALGDEVGELLGARVVALLVGERPGLSSPDSLGIYLTWAPRVGRSDAERNCISNIRPEGLSYEQAASTLAGLLEGAKRLGASGIVLKDETLAPAPDALGARLDFGLDLIRASDATPDT
ncbi:MAG: ethanolamine ammonia-lyase subunit EutC [Burkholderiales bacterium]